MYVDKNGTVEDLLNEAKKEVNHCCYTCAVSIMFSVSRSLSVMIARDP